MVTADHSKKRVSYYYDCKFIFTLTLLFNLFLHFSGYWFLLLWTRTCHEASTHPNVPSLVVKLWSLSLLGSLSSVPSNTRWHGPISQRWLHSIPENCNSGQSPSVQQANVEIQCWRGLPCFWWPLWVLSIVQWRFLRWVWMLIMNILIFPD